MAFLSLRHDERRILWGLKRMVASTDPSTPAASSLESRKRYGRQTDIAGIVFAPHYNGRAGRPTPSAFPGNLGLFPSVRVIDAPFSSIQIGQLMSPSPDWDLDRYR